MCTRRVVAVTDYEHLVGDKFKKIILPLHIRDISYQAKNYTENKKHVNMH
jgi:hypothetical protein